MSIVCFRQHRTIVDEQIDDIQKSVLQEARSILEDIRKCLRVCDLNDGKPEVIYRTLMDAKFKTENLVSDLNTDTRI